MRYIGEEVNINPNFDNSEIILIKREDYEIHNKHISNPAIWIEFEGWLYFGICKSYYFDFLEDFSDWDKFDGYNPGYLEFLQLMRLKPTFYKVDYKGIMESDLDDWCKFELDFLKKWWREKQINSLLK
jgi:hypothetical protein